MSKTALAVLVSILFSPVVFSQNNRSAVSLTGNDAASCTVRDPCGTCDVAISKTNPGGEVIVLSLAGYGPFTVTKSVAIISPPACHGRLRFLGRTPVRAGRLRNSLRTIVRPLIPAPAFTQAVVPEQRG